MMRKVLELKIGSFFQSNKKRLSQNPSWSINPFFLFLTVAIFVVI